MTSESPQLNKRRIQNLDGRRAACPRAGRPLSVNRPIRIRIRLQHLVMPALETRNHNPGAESCHALVSLSQE